MKPGANGKQEQVYVAAPITRVSGNPVGIPADYTDIDDFFEQETELRQMALRPAHAWAELLPQHDGTHPSVEQCTVKPTGTEHDMLETQRMMASINAEKGVEFLKKCSNHMSSFIKARILQDRRRGLTDCDQSIKNGLAVAVELGLPALQTEAKDLLESGMRAGRSATHEADEKWKVKFGHIQNHGKVCATQIFLMGKEWTAVDYGDTITGCREDPISDAYWGMIHERNQCLDIHLAAGEVHSAISEESIFDIPGVMRRGRQIRWEQPTRRGRERK